MATDWYYAVGESELGPVPISQLRELARAGRLRADDLVWSAGMADWVEASTVSELGLGQAPTTRRKTSAPRGGTRVRPSAPAGRPGPRGAREADGDGERSSGRASRGGGRMPVGVMIVAILDLLNGLGALLLAALGGAVLAQLSDSEHGVAALQDMAGGLALVSALTGVTFLTVAVGLFMRQDWARVVNVIVLGVLAFAGILAAYRLGGSGPAIAKALGNGLVCVLMIFPLLLSSARQWCGGGATLRSRRGGGRARRAGRSGR